MENKNTASVSRPAQAENTIDLIDLLSYLLYHWIPIALATVICAIGAFGYSVFIMTPTYTSSSVLYVLSKSTSITSMADIQTGTSLTNDYLVVVKSRPVLDQVITNLDLNMTSMDLSYKVSVSNPTDTRLLYITVTDPSREEAKRIADEIADVASSFIAVKMDQDPPSIIQYGYSDGVKVSPNVTKNTMVGGLAGFVIVAGIFLAIYLLNDKIMTPDDVEKKLGLNTLGIIPNEGGKRKKEAKGEHSAHYAKLIRRGDIK